MTDIRPPKLLPGTLLHNSKYKINSSIGSGTFGDLYSATDLKTGKLFAVKVESKKLKRFQLQHEQKIYTILDGGTRVPSCYLYSSTADYNYLILEHLGPSLEDLFIACRRNFSTHTVILLADQMLRGIEWMHSRRLLHRDIKPDNFLMGLGENSDKVYLVDFGLSKFYVDLKTNDHIPLKYKDKLTGTARYVSINCHDGVENSRRDDLEAAGYVLLYFELGKFGGLPWQHLKASSKRQKHEKIANIKSSLSISEMCEKCRKITKPVLEEYLKYCRDLVFDDEPDYIYLRSLFRDVCLSRRIAFSLI